MAWPDAPIVCVVSDRSRLGPVEPPAEEWAGYQALLDRLTLAADAGADLIQVREPDLSARDLYELVSRLRARTGETAARIVVNDRLDVAFAAGAHGVHLKGESIATVRVRALAPAGFLVGRSVHAIDEAAAAAADGADYVMFGTVFPTPSKPEGHRTAGLEALAAVVQRVAIPVLAIGGVTVARAPAVAAAGAAGLAAIGLFLGPSGPAERVRQQLEATIDAVRRAFVESRSNVT